jgi:hypothetical protein
MTRAPLRSTDPLGRARGSSTTTLVFCGSRPVEGLPEE